MRATGKKSYVLQTLILGMAIAFALGLSVGLILPHLPVLGGKKVWSGEGAQQASVDIAAVSEDGSGLICGLTARVMPGEGRILADINPLVGFDFQYAHWTAVKVASEITGYALDADGVGIENVDVLFIVLTPSGIKIHAIDGPSAGAAATIATIAALENRKLRDDIIITGRVLEDHGIGLVGGVAAKAETANESGIKYFLVPEGQYIETYERHGIFYIVKRQPISYLQDYAKQHGWGIEIIEVPTIEEAAKYFFS